MTELQALQNAVNMIGIEAIRAIEWQPHDKRMIIKKYFLRIGSTKISPNLDYEQMNHFILGMIRMKDIYSHN